MSKVTGDGYELVALGNRRADITMYGLVGMQSRKGSIMSGEFKSQLESLGPLDQIDMKINSPGGSVDEGMAIYNILNRHSARIVGTVDGVCGSIMTVVAMACDELLMSEGSLFFIHECHSLFSEDEMVSSTELRKRADMNDKTSAQMRDIYARRTGLPREKLASMMAAETFMTPLEAVEYKFATGIAQVRSRRAACLGMERYVAKIPDECKHLFEAEPVKKNPNAIGMKAKARLLSMKAQMAGVK